jgi:dihydroorotase-like cyclic amidohydrolase
MAPKTPEELQASKDRANQKRSLRRMWGGDMPFDEIVEVMGMDAASVLSLAASMHLGERVEPDCYLPTEAEITAATWAFRAKWTPAERERRLG